MGQATRLAPPPTPPLPGSFLQAGSIRPGGGPPRAAPAQPGHGALRRRAVHAGGHGRAQHCKGVLRTRGRNQRGRVHTGAVRSHLDCRLPKCLEGEGEGLGTLLASPPGVDCINLFLSSCGLVVV